MEEKQTNLNKRHRFVHGRMMLRTRIVFIHTIDWKKVRKNKTGWGEE